MKTRIDKKGYELLTVVDRNQWPIFVHVLIAEKALGKPLPPKAVIHHANEIKSDNRPSNLVICPNHAYHAILHRRIDSKKACGHTSWRKCSYCKKYDDPVNLYIPKTGMTRHRSCYNAYRREDYKDNPLAKQKNRERSAKYRKALLSAVGETK